jgi:hypothetical protein
LNDDEALRSNDHAIEETAERALLLGRPRGNTAGSDTHTNSITSIYPLQEVTLGPMQVAGNSHLL